MSFLCLFVAIPLLMLVSFIPCGNNMKAVRTVAVTGASMLLALAIYTVCQFISERNAGNTAEMLFRSDWMWYPALHIHLSVGVDGISVAMLMLSSVIVFTGVFASWHMNPLPRDFFMWYSLLATGVFGFFISIDLFTMVLFYEVALIPMYLLIGLWGTGPKEYAAMKLTLMLMGGSAFMILGILGIYFSSGFAHQGHFTFNLLEIAQQGIPVEAQRIFFPFAFIGFGVLGALFPFHTWSPDGHSSAPTAVSMLHAGVLMKLGGYGCYRVAVTVMPEAAHEQAPIFLILTGISVVYGAVGAIRQTDIKSINAYSSVSHCGLVLFAILMLNETATTCAFMQMVSHGLMTALFFALIGMIYGRTHTRDIREMGGLMRVIPFLSVCYVIAGLASLGLPGLSGFVSEMTIFVGSFQHEDLFRRILTILAVSSIVITAVYILRVIGKILYGTIQDKHHEQLTDAFWYEKVAVVLLIVLIAGMGMYPSFISGLIRDGFTWLTPW